MGAEILANIGADFSAMETARKRDEQAWRQWASNNGNSIASLTARINAETAKMQTAEASQLSALRDKQRAYRTTLGIDAATMATQNPLQSWGIPTGAKSPEVGMRGLTQNALRLRMMFMGGLGAGALLMFLKAAGDQFDKMRKDAAEFAKELEDVRRKGDSYGRASLGGITELRAERDTKIRGIQQEDFRSTNNLWLGNLYQQPMKDLKSDQMSRAYGDAESKMLTVQVREEEKKLELIRLEASGQKELAKFKGEEWTLTKNIVEAQGLGAKGAPLLDVLRGQRQALREAFGRDEKNRGLEQQADYWREGVLRDTNITSESQRQLDLLVAQLDAQKAITAAARTGLEAQRGKTKEAELELQITQAKESQEQKRITREAAMQAAGLRSEGVTGQIARLNIEHVALEKQRDATKDAEKRRDIELQIAQNEQQQAAVGKQREQQVRSLDTDYQRQMILNNRSNPFRKFDAADFSTRRSIEDYESETDPLKKLERRNKLAGDVGSLQDMRWSLISRPTLADDMTRIGGGGFSYAGPNTSDTLKSIDDNIKRLLEAMSSHTTAPNAMNIAVMSN